MKLAPLGDKVVLKQVEAQETTKSGIVLTSQAKEKPQEAVVIAVGDGAEVDGKKTEMHVKEGDKVLFSQYSGTEIKIEDEEYVIVSEKDIMAIVE